MDRGQISAVIDFGDLTAGDRATDLSIAWMMLPSTHHETLRHAYRAATARPAADDLWRPACGGALALAVAFLSHSSDNSLIADIGQRTLKAVLRPADPLT